MAKKKKKAEAEDVEATRSPPDMGIVSAVLWGACFLALAFVPDQKILRYKLLAVESGVWALLLCLAFSWVLKARAEWIRTPLDIPVALYAAGAVLFYAVSPERGPSSLELTRMLFCAATFFAATQTLPLVRSPRRVLWVWGASAGLLGVYALLQTRGGVGRLMVPQLDRPIATFGNPIFLAAYFSASAAVLLGLVRTAGSRWEGRIAAAFGLLALAGLLTTQSRGAAAGIGVAALAAAAASLDGRRRWLAVAGVVASGALAVWLFRHRQWTHGLIWRDSLSLWLAHPFMGCGLGRFHIEFPGYASETLRQLWPQRAVIINFAHNEYLQVLAETGILGFSLLLSVLAASMYWLARVWRPMKAGAERALTGSLALGAAALLGQNLFSPDIRFGLSSFILFFCLGAAVSRTAGAAAPIPPFPGRMGAAAMAGALLLVWGHLAIRPVRAQRRLKAEPRFHVSADERLERTLEALEMKLAADPADADIAENLAYLYAKRKSWPQAISRFEIASRLDPGRPGPLNNLGNIYYSMGDRERAIAYWNRSVRVRPSQVDAHLNLGKALYEVGRLKESSAHLQAVLKTEPDNEKAQILLKKMIE